MAKHHKSNHRRRLKKREEYVNGFFAREQEINKLINKFINQYKTLQYPPSIDEYQDMDKQRLEIKRLFSLQEGELWKQSHRRRRFYYKQLRRFKYHYVAWKRYTYYTYLHLRFDMPLHLIHPLNFYRKHTHDILCTVYAM